MSENLRYYFDDMIVHKDLKKSAFFSTLNLPSFMRDWLLKRFSDDLGEYDVDAIKDFVSRRLPSVEDWLGIKDQLINERENVKILAKVSIDISVNKEEMTFTLPDYQLKSSETIIEKENWTSFKDQLLNGRETWGIVELGYMPPQEKPKKPGKITLEGFQSFRPYEVDLDYYKEARSHFTLDEWIDVLLGAIDYNASGFGMEENKLSMLTRLLPFVERRVNLIELAPKGTGKSYVYGRVSRFGWLASGGKLTRAQLFFNKATGAEGLLSNNDYVVFDEVQSLDFDDPDAMCGALKNFMEQGVCTIADHELKGDAGVVLSGNIAREKMNADGYANMFEDLPKIIRETAFLERFHGFIRGWNIPRMNEDLKISDWALNSEYFTSILHELREDISYRMIVDEIVAQEGKIDTRDVEAIKRIATAYLKLLFPHVKSASDVNARDFNKYCLSRAKDMRNIVVYQLGLVDVDYRNKQMPNLYVDESKCHG
ncbi:MAG: BREX system Lon protease-like protein BrxL [Thermoguttaceae bacterium]|nr:BREX system Lon protease-like protein BrxL [Thermoguttaceae bacterium]